MTIDQWVVASNVALFVVTLLAVYQTAKESHRHEEVETEKIAKIAHELIKAEAADKATAEQAIAANQTASVKR